MVNRVIQNRYLDSIYIRWDIYNTRTFFHQYNFNSYIPTSIFLKVSHNNEVKYIKQMDLDGEIRLLGIIFILVRYIYIVQRFPTVMIINNIYNINRFNNPFY
ncbi:hypothetical protein QR685DRAFT_574505 [Neurospora intermedia]|uniref:Uncharacterized protein n=1 Tax=Neurospora intermedia TaxID=5142 RepID=A0ABR3D4X4_NEUIN